jgi:G3E family GTPase
MPTNEPKIPVTVLTGFLGSGKTTLLNRILSEHHGQRIAVIENEFGEIGVDQELVINAEEEIFEMNNGCICCTVRGDLIRILGNLMQRRSKFDRIIVETTGMANPGPVAQTFLVDEDTKAQFSLDGIVTMIDARHFADQVDRNKEVREQIAFADVIVLNKTDLVDASALDALENRIRSMNAMARIERAEPQIRAGVAIEKVLGIGGFDLARALEYQPTFLVPEYPFECLQQYELDSQIVSLTFEDGPDPSISLALFAALPGENASDAAERAFIWFSVPQTQSTPGTRLSLAERKYEIDLSSRGAKHIEFDVPSAGRYWLALQHLPEEFALRVTGCNKEFFKPVDEQRFAPGHSHDDDVTSISLEADKPLDANRFDNWLMRELQVQGNNIYRLKGFLNFHGHEQRIVIQGVHMLSDMAELGPWGDRLRKTQLVFIGRDLDSESLIQGFEACVIT